MAVMYYCHKFINTRTKTLLCTKSLVYCYGYFYGDVFRVLVGPVVFFLHRLGFIHGLPHYLKLSCTASVLYVCLCAD